MRLHRDLGVGAKGADIAELQVGLAGLGCALPSDDVCDTMFGVGTAQAVGGLQQAHGLVPTAVVDTATAEALGRAVRDQAEPTRVGRTEAERPLVERPIPGRLAGPDGAPSGVSENERYMDELRRRLESLPPGQATRERIASLARDARTPAYHLAGLAASARAATQDRTAGGMAPLPSAVWVRLAAPGPRPGSPVKWLRGVDELVHAVRTAAAEGTIPPVPEPHRPGLPELIRGKRLDILLNRSRLRRRRRVRCARPGLAAHPARNLPAQLEPAAQRAVAEIVFDRDPAVDEAPTLLRAAGLDEQQAAVATHSVAA
jgi:hypothetical protein